MASGVAAGVVHESLLARVTSVLAGLAFDVSVSATPKRLALTVYDGVADQPPTYPYVIVGGGSRETAFNTLGPRDGAKWGSEVSTQVRVVTQFPTSEAQTYQMLSALKGPLDGTKLTVAGYPTAIVTFEEATLLVDTINGKVTRELVAAVDVLTHQS